MDDISIVRQCTEMKIGNQMVLNLIIIWNIHFIFSDGHDVFNHLNIFRFQLYYYSDAEFKKEERKDTVLTIDTRTKIDKVKQLHLLHCYFTRFNFRKMGPL